MKNKFKYSFKYVIYFAGITILVAVMMLMCACSCNSENSQNEKKNKPNDTETQNVEIGEELKAVSDNLSNNTLYELMAIENATYPCKDTNESPYKQSVMKFIQDMGMRSKIVFNEDLSTKSYYYDISATGGFENIPPIVLYSDIDLPHGNNQNDLNGVSYNEEKGEIIGNNQCSLAAKSYMGISTALAIIKDKTIQHGKIRIIFAQNIQQVLDSPLTKEYTYIVNLSGSTKVGKAGIQNSELFNSFNNFLENCYKTSSNLIMDKFDIDIKTQKNIVYVGPDIVDEGTTNEKIYTKSLKIHDAFLITVLTSLK